jgi:splicing factor 3B subunit 4
LLNLILDKSVYSSSQSETKLDHTRIKRLIVESTVRTQTFNYPRLRRLYMASVAGGRITAGAGTNLLGQHAADRNQDATVYVGNIDPQADEELIWELFVQVAPVVSVYMPKDRVTSQYQGYGFVELKSEEDAEYAIRILNMVRLFGKPLRVSKSSQDRVTLDIGANLFIGNLDPNVDEKLLYDTFSAFGVILNQPKVSRDPETGLSKGFGFISFGDFEASDAALEAMNGQWLMNRQIMVSYAFKKDDPNERHGTPAERLLAAQLKMKQKAGSWLQPHKLFAAGPKAQQLKLQQQQLQMQQQMQQEQMQQQAFHQQQLYPGFPQQQQGMMVMPPGQGGYYPQQQQQQQQQEGGMVMIHPSYQHQGMMMMGPPGGRGQGGGWGQGGGGGRGPRQHPGGQFNNHRRQPQQQQDGVPPPPPSPPPSPPPR